MKIFFRYFKPYILFLAVSVALLYSQATCDLSLPDFMSDIVNKGITTGNTSYILKVGFQMLGIALISACCTILVGFIAARIAAGVSRDMRQDIFTKIESFSNTELEKYSTSSLITRTTNDITQIQQLIVMVIRIVFYAPIMGVGGVIHALDKNKSMSWIIALSVALLLVVVFSMLAVVMPSFQFVQKLIDRLNLVVRESLEGTLVIRAFNTQRFEEKRFEKVNARLTETNLFVNRVTSGMMPAMMLIMNLTNLLIIWVGSKAVSSFRMEVGDMMAYMQYVMQIIMAFLMMTMMFIMIPRAIVSIRRVVEVLQTEPSIADPKVAAVIPKSPKGVVEYRDVSFRYPDADEDVLHNITFTAMPGRTTAFIGATGSGKSTLVNLLPRFYDVTSGEILIDGINIKDWPIHQLRGIIGFVPQKGILFSGTIESNLMYGDRKATKEQIEEAAQTAQATEFINSKADGLESSIAQGGGNVSGGQKQRLSIARALVKRAPVNVFDDSFSALDFKTDAKLRAALREKTGDSAIFLVAQRISTIMNADQIIVLEHGRIAGKGTHRELMKTCEVYREIALSQLSEEELK
ncbi:ABC transporter ATP-binding protein [Lacrimispora sphenoides]|uniref:ATP-binding cassette, subfamily B n=1 Tax=Lacrimispora sphenoides JCM 1415 TaxID=1297793 RepID=A0ABY1C2Z2_9FIRM|nr:ABC transporter ATP-binding protein [Lacrimispora sphenoides]SET58878.1 ATP-binding cassette, subfamily B [[Clostridium] sphenoides JCM 1415]SUY49926.1 ABC-type multidrug transport system, ATPase and permease components [Lacrimispora sphenoides]